MDELKLIAAGAEAYLFKGKFLGYDVVVKYRVPKPYRDRRLDELIRSERTVIEAKCMMMALNMGVKVPTILYVNPSTAIIVMEYIEGDLLRDCIRVINEVDLNQYLELLGSYVGKLHLNNIVHGDLTTSNVILSRSGDLYLVDFGLARISHEIEDKAIDLHLMMRSLESTHYSLVKKALDSFLGGYGKVINDVNLRRVLEKVREIRMRGRYIEERRSRRLK